jgi:MOSC domain-containing protein YiiM
MISDLEFVLSQVSKSRPGAPGEQRTWIRLPCLYQEVDRMTFEASMDTAVVVSVNSSPRHVFSKQPQSAILLVAGMGVEGDAHAGPTVQHVYDKRRDPDRPNLRQVHLIHAELFELLAQKGFVVGPGELGENITTRGIDLLHLPEGTVLTMGKATIRITGLRNPCSQIDRFQPGLMKHLIEDARSRRFLCGVMGTVESGGAVRPGDAICITLPQGEPIPLGVV